MLTTTLQAGSSYGLTVYAGQYAEGYAAWIDYNDDGVFAASERVGYSNGMVSGSGSVGVLGSSATFPIVLACNPPIGPHRLRVRAMYFTNGIDVTPCTANSYGETEDYVITLSAPAACPQPSLLTASAITSTSATLSWTIGCAETAWEVAVQTAGTGTPSGAGTAVTATSFPASALTPGTAYEFYVRANCTVDGFSLWSGPFNFSTAPPCTTEIAPVDGSTGVQISGSTFNISWNASPGATGYDVYFGTTSGSTTLVASNIPGTSYNASGLVNGTTYFWKVNPRNSSATASCPEWSFTTVNCYPPTALASSAITTSGATISWTAPTLGATAEYQYEVRTSGAAGSGPAGLVTSGTEATTTLMLSGLSAATNYTVYVRTNCGGTDNSNWANTVFATACGAISALPWTEGFESISTTGTGIVPNCWLADGSGYWSSTADNTYNTAYAGTKYIRYRWAASNVYVWTPGFQMTAGTAYDFSYWAQGDGWTGWSADVMVNTSQDATGATQVGATYTAPGNDIVAIQPYAQVTRTFIAPADGVYYFAIKGNQPSGTPWYMAFDNFSLQLSPPTIVNFTPPSTCSASSDAERTIVITGSAFAGATSVQVNGTEVNTTPELTPILNGDTSVCVGGDGLDLDNLSFGGTWSSSNEEIATIDADGIVTGVSEGSVVITYTVEDFGCSASTTTNIAVYEAPMATNPGAVTVVTGSDAVFSVTASGNVTGYQWMVSSDGGDNFTNVVDDAVYSGSNTATLTINQTPDTLNENLYMVVITGETPCGTFESTAALLTVGDTGIQTDPVSVSLCSTGSGIAVFDVVGSGTVNSYSWEEDQGIGFMAISDGTMGGVTYSGSSTNQLTVSGLSTANSGWAYRAVLTGPANIATSNAALLTVGQGVAIDTHPVSASNCYAGSSSVFNVVGSGTIEGYQWQYSSNGTTWNNVVNGTPNGATYTGAGTASMTVATTSATPAGGTYFYRAIVNGSAACGNVTSDSAQLMIFTPAITSQPVAASVTSGSSTAFTVATSAPGATYQWQYASAVGGPYANVANATPAGVTYANATGATLTVNVSGTAAASNQRYYRAVVTSAGCSVTSAAAQMTIVSYCTPAPGSQDGTGIVNFTMGSINNSTGSEPGY